MNCSKVKTLQKQNSRCLLEEICQLLILLVNKLKVDIQQLLVKITTYQKISIVNLSNFVEIRIQRK